MFDYDVPPIRLGPAFRRAGLISFLLTLVAAHGERAHICTMADLRVTCICGAIYEVIRTKGPSREARPFKCVLCDRELWAREENNVVEFRLVWRPDEDRE